MLKDFLEVIKKNRLFEGIGILELENMLNCLKPVMREYNKNDYAAMTGERFDSIGVIVKGSAAVVKEDEDGNRVIMTILRPGDMFGEMAAFSNRPVWPASVYVQEKCSVCFIPADKITAACSNACNWHTILIRNLLKIISEKAMMLNKKVDYLTIKSMRGRICSFLMEQHKKTGGTTIYLTMNRDELADFLNVSRSSMSREMCRMRDEGIIDFHKETFKLLNIQALHV